MQAWARDGLNDEQIAHNIGIATGTLYDWKKAHPLIAEALKKGKEVADIEVENALFKRALGYDVEETKAVVDASGKKQIIKTTRHVPPDVGAAIFWLKNRKPAQWRDKPIIPEVTQKEVDLLSAAFKELEALGDAE